MPQYLLIITSHIIITTELMPVVDDIYVTNHRLELKAAVAITQSQKSC